MRTWRSSFARTIKVKYTMQMDYEGSSFKPVWKDGLLRIRAYRLESDTFDLMGIILDAAIEQEEFKLAWDLRDMEPVSVRQMWSVISFGTKIQPKLHGAVTASSILVSPKYEKTLRFILKYAGPSSPCYVGTDAHEAKRFLS